MKIQLTLDLVVEAFLVVYLLSTAVKGTCELRKENQRLTWEKDLPWPGHPSWPVKNKAQLAAEHFTDSPAEIPNRNRQRVKETEIQTAPSWMVLTFQGSPDREIRQREGMSDQEGAQGKGQIQFTQRPGQTGLATQTASAELQPVVDLQIIIRNKKQEPPNVAINLNYIHNHTHLSLLHHVGSVEAKSRSHPGQVPTDGVGIIELDRTEEGTVNRWFIGRQNNKRHICTPSNSNYIHTVTLFLALTYLPHMSLPVKWK